MDDYLAVSYEEGVRFFAIVCPMEGTREYCHKDNIGSIIVKRRNKTDLEEDWGSLVPLELC